MLGMTGYSFNEQYLDDLYLATELKTVNHRFLDINISIPFILNSVELKIRDFLQKRLSRGKIDVIIQFKFKENRNSITIDESAAKKYYEALKKVCVLLDIKEEVKLFHLTKFDDIFVIDKKRDYTEYWDVIEGSLLKNINDVVKMRQNEGEETKKDLLFIMSQIKKNLAVLTEQVPAMERTIFQNIKDKIVELIGDKVDEIRLLNEVSIMVSKSCINEEIERLKIHTDHFLSIIEESVDVGKRLDFICQEMHREINTIGSKITDANLTGNVISVKNYIEKIREQIRNIE